MGTEKTTSSSWISTTRDRQQQIVTNARQRGQTTTQNDNRVEYVTGDGACRACVEIISGESNGIDGNNGHNAADTQRRATSVGIRLAGREGTLWRRRAGEKTGNCTARLKRIAQAFSARSRWARFFRFWRFAMCASCARRVSSESISRVPAFASAKAPLLQTRVATTINEYAVSMSRTQMHEFVTVETVFNR
jgi:hypothetical protein